MPAELIAPALACGNAVVWTPAPSTAVCAVALAQCIADADLPPGVFNLVTGPGPVVGDEIARNPGIDGVAFIGSTATGRLVGQAAAGKATLLEMGGNGPLVVMDDADLEARCRGDTDRLLLVRRPELHRRRAAPGPPRRARRVRRVAGASRDRARSCSATRSTTPRRWGRSTTSRSRRRWTSTSSDAVERGASVVSGGVTRERIPHLAVLAADGAHRCAAPTPGSLSRRPSDRSLRLWRSVRSRKRSR